MREETGLLEGTFGLGDVLQALGISRYRLAKRLGTTQDWLGRLHKQKNLPKFDTLTRIARELGVSVGVLVVGDPAREEFFRGCPQSSTGRVPPANSPPKKPRKPRKRAAG